ncbi:hypothetical protein KIH39_24095 [Telmatocola sphagniphila]|uniref:Uncharacterized protein n=1 Tax=Telmatocola sphagniphila TaxID=1123043 RepID=A0A8E6EUY0_9BACT|nr:hypothetical protein [Telmatocola sphagniphila]QVL31882.1 hypothetical protein KIH39_24095 [Telmatocola sphagniphila]
MDLGLLIKIFGESQSWHGPCIAIVAADASVKTPGPDHIMGGGNKVYAPRITSGRVSADAICLLPDQRALLVIQRSRHKQTTGEESLQESLLVLDIGHLVGLEFENTRVLRQLGLAAPLAGERQYTPGSLMG